MICGWETTAVTEHICSKMRQLFHELRTVLNSESTTCSTDGHKRSDAALPAVCPFAHMHTATVVIPNFCSFCDTHKGKYLNLRDAANWLPSRFGLSVETRREYGWVRMVFSGVRLFRAPIWWPSGGWRHARGREHCRGEPGGSLSGGYAPDSAKAEGSSIVDEPGEG